MSRGPVFNSRVRSWLPIVVLSALTIYAYAPYHTVQFAGLDVFTSIDTSRVSSWSDFVGLWTQPFMAGSSFPETAALIYRPLVGLTFALDYALWGLNSLGYFATNVLLHLAAGLLLYAFLRTLTLSWWASSLGAGVFLFHPALIGAVPMLSRRHDAFASAALFGSMALLCLSLNLTGWRGRLARGASLALFAAALLGKESAFGAVPLLPLVLLAAWVLGRDGGVQLSVFTRALVPYFAVAAAVFAVRYAVLGGLGGFVGTSLAEFDLAVAQHNFNRYVLYLFWPFRELLPTTGTQWLPVLVVAAPAMMGAMALLSRRYRVLVGLGVAWVAGFGGFFVSLQTLAGPWYLYYPLAGVGLIVAGASEAMVGLVREAIRAAAPPVGRKAVRLSGGVLLLGLVGVYLAAILSVSPLLKYYPEWAQLGEMSRRYLAVVLDCTQDISDNATLTLHGAPSELWLRTPESELLVLTLFHDFTLESAIRLMQGRDVSVRIADGYMMLSSVRDPATSCQGEPNDRELGAGWG